MSAEVCAIRKYANRLEESLVSKTTAAMRKGSFIGLKPSSGLQKDKGEAPDATRALLLRRNQGLGRRRILRRLKPPQDDKKV